jgi:pyrimidine-nucleoside phosphorylase
MVRLGTECGLRVHALLNPMDVPLGRAAGNWVEVKEAVECLQGGGPEDLRQLVIECAAHLLLLTKKAESLESGRDQATKCLASGKGYNRWRMMLEAQGTNWKAFEKKLTEPEPTMELRSDRAGYISDCDARIIGEVIRDLGGGRTHKDAAINHAVGLTNIAKPGDRVERGSPLCRIHGVSDLPHSVRAALLTAFTVMP